MYPVNPNPSDPHVAKIAALNDRFRRTLDGGRVVLTRGVSTLGKEMVAAILDEVRDYETFSPESDPYDEHDFGSFELDEHALLWKIDYYDAAFEYHAEDAADPSKSNRVLTIMLAEEY